MTDSKSEKETKLSEAELQDLVASTDNGARDPKGIQRTVLLGTACAGRFSNFGLHLLYLFTTGR